MDYTDIPLEDCPTGDEGAMLLFALDRVHRQFAWKSGGLTSEHLGTRHPPSGVTVAGTMVHLAKVEEMWTAAAAGREPGPPVIGTESYVGYDAEWQEAPTLPSRELYGLWYGTIAQCRQELGQANRRRRTRRPMHRRPRLRGQPPATTGRHSRRKPAAHRPGLDHPRSDRRFDRQRPALIDARAAQPSLSTILLRASGQSARSTIRLRHSLE